MERVIEDDVVSLEREIALGWDWLGQLTSPVVVPRLHGWWAFAAVPLTCLHLDQV